MEQQMRNKKVYRVTLAGSAVNLLLVALKLVAGIVGSSAAMVADAVHSLTDLLTDAVVIMFVKLSAKPQDDDHDYGHGKYETLATSIIGLALLAVGLLICVYGVVDIIHALRGSALPQPDVLAVWAALLSILLKEWTYRFTIRAAHRLHSAALEANAWHHRSDAFSSVGTAIGVGAAVIMGSGYAILDPIAAVIVSLFIIKAAVALIIRSVGELLEQSLPAEVEQEICQLVLQQPQVSGIHHLRTRCIGNGYAIEMHIRMPGNISLYEAHQHATAVENALKEHFGPHTHVGIHMEPLKQDGTYVAPTQQEKQSTD